ncbi:MAG TPA: family 16 glycosylhydrolase [Planctomycetota bacterium]|nr:family 16 glycosylhydrolase [Planctomycetota bacterium]
MNACPCPLPHGRWAPLPEMTDEFEGEALDAAKWHPTNPGWLGRQPGLFRAENVTVSDGKLHITMKHESLPNAPKGYHTYTCGAVKSKAVARYGYFEVKARAMKSRGSSAFWFYLSTPELWTEIDVFEIGGGAPGHETTVHMNAHVFHTLVNPDRHWSKGSKWQSPTPLADGWHVYGLEWNREKLVYYFDGAVVREMPNTHWHQPLELNFDSETMPEWFGLPDVATLPSTFCVEYVRAWKRLDAPPDDTPRTCVFTFPSERAKAARSQTLTWRLKTDDDGTLRVLAQFSPAGAKTLVHLEYDNDAFFAAQTAERVERTLVARDTAGRELRFTFHWLKTRDEKKRSGYRADTLEIGPAARPGAGAVEVYELASQEGEAIRLTLEW